MKDWIEQGAIIDARPGMVNEDGMNRERPPVSITHGNITIVMDEDRLFSLNQIWRDAGSPKNREPKEWAKLPSAREFMANLAEDPNGGKSPIWKSKRGKHLSGCWGHWKVVAEYAGYLDPDIKSRVYDALKQWAEEEADPALKVERATEAFVKQGHPDDWAKLRIMTIFDRNLFSRQLGGSGVVNKGPHDNGFAKVTDRANVIVFRATSKEIKEILGLAPSARVRDRMSSVQLSIINTVEVTTMQKLRDNPEIRGNEACEELHARVATAFARALDEINIDVGFRPKIEHKKGKV